MINNLVWIRTAKCAGASVKTAVRDLATPNTVKEDGSLLSFTIPSKSGPLPVWIIKHGDHDNFTRNHPGIYGDALRFAIVRNPWDRAVSSYLFCKKEGAIPDEMGFSRFIKSISDTIITDTHGLPEASSDSAPDHEKSIRHHNPFIDKHIRPLYDVITGSSGTIDPDIRLIRFENLQESLNKLLEECGIGPITLPHRHQSERRETESYYSRETAELVRKAYIHDVEAFGYAFPNSSQ